MLLTVVAVSRNDDHGGNLLRRMQCFVDVLCHGLRTSRNMVEVVLVEWNPPVDRPRLKDVIEWPSRRPNIQVRIIEVPQPVHRRFPHSESLPLFQMIAKNVGIRRARGKFVLATNVDVMFSEELAAFLSSGEMDGSCFYRIDRLDVAGDMPVGMSPAQCLEFCGRHVIRRNGRRGNTDLRTGESHMIFPPDSWREGIHEWAQDVGLVHVSTRARLHTNGAGDFTLLARDKWHALRGYPEWARYSMHIDAVLCFAAFHSGLREVVLEDPMRLYHVEHGAGSGWTPEGEALLNERLRRAGIPQVSHARFERFAKAMRQVRRPSVVNDIDWGLDGIDLPETRL